MPVTEDQIRVSALGDRTWCMNYDSTGRVPSFFSDYHNDYEDMGRCKAVRKYLRWLNTQLDNAELEWELGALEWDAEDEEEEEDRF